VGVVGGGIGMGCVQWHGKLCLECGMDGYSGKVAWKVVFGKWYGKLFFGKRDGKLLLGSGMESDPWSTSRVWWDRLVCFVFIES
jgi:hypothetical protein